MTGNKSYASEQPSREELREVRRQIYRWRQPRSGRPSKAELRGEAGEMHREFPERTEEELYDDLEFANYAFPTLEERIAMQWDRFRWSRSPKDFAELKRFLARRKEFRTRARR